MKFLILLASALLLVQSASASPAKSSAKKPTPSRDKNAKLGTSFRFDGTSLQGKRQNPMATTVTVENDKFLEDLLGARSHFEDREKKDQERN